MRHRLAGTVIVVLFLVSIGAASAAGAGASPASNGPGVGPGVSFDGGNAVHPAPAWPTGGAPQGDGGSINTGNGINYNGGPVIAIAKVVAIYWSSSTIYNGGPTPGTHGTGSQDGSLVGYFLGHLAASPYYNTNTTYGDTVGNGHVVHNAVSYTGYWADGTGTPATTQAGVQTEIANGLNSGVLTYDASTVYMVFGPPTVDLGGAANNNWCAYHSYFTWNGHIVAYADMPHDLTLPLPNGYTCSAQVATGSNGSPNGDAAGDVELNLMAHELSEANTDPQLNAWYDSSGEENADKCAWTWGNLFNAPDGALANATIGTKPVLIQQIWLNANGGLCAQAYAAPQTISFTTNAPSGATIGGPTYTPAATATSGLPVTLSIDAGATSVCAMSSGVVSFIAAGSCIIDANQPGNADYLAAPQVSQSFGVGKPTPTLTYTGTTAATTNAAVTLAATLTINGAAIPGETVAFLLNGVTKTATTNGSGVASVGSTAPGTAGQYPISVTFAGDGTYASASTSATLTVSSALPAPNLAYTGATSAAPNASITLKAKLTTSGGAAISGRTITFHLNGATLTHVTNSNGVASIATSAPSTGGAYPIGVTFAGDSTYGPASTSATLNVSGGKPVPVLTYTGVASVVHGRSFALKAKLTKAGGGAISGETITFTFNGANHTATTNANGVASVSVVAPTTPSSYPVSASFAGDATYAATSTSSTISVT